MSDAITRRIKQLENQNQKFKKLLESTLQITSEDSAKCMELQNEANFLRKAVSDLENQKQQLEGELKHHLNQEYWKAEVNASVDIQHKLNNALNDIQRETAQLQRFETEDQHLQKLIADLEYEKDRLLNDIRLVKKANDENNKLAQENLKLKHELAMLQTSCGSIDSKSSGQDLIKKLASLENMKLKLQADIEATKKTPDPLGIAVENTVLELKISGLEKQKENILKNLRAKLLQSANEISQLHCNTSDGQLRGLLNELDIHKTILMMSLSDVKELHDIEEKDKDFQANNYETHKDIIRMNYCGIKTNSEDDPSATLKQDLLNSVNQQISVKMFLNSQHQEDLYFKQADDCSIASTSSNKLTIINPSTSLPSTASSEVLQEITETNSTDFMETKSDDDISRYEETRELPTVSEEDEIQNSLLAEHEQLKDEINRLEREREQLLMQIQQINTQSWDVINTSNRILISEFGENFIGETSSVDVQRPPLDDATNQLYANEEQLLAQRIRELEEDNERIRTDLKMMLDETQSDKEDIQVLEEGERLIQNHLKESIIADK